MGQISDIVAIYIYIYICENKVQWPNSNKHNCQKKKKKGNI